MEEMGSEQVLQLVRCTLAVPTYDNIDIHLTNVLKETFSTGGVTVGLLNGGVLLQKVLE